MTINRGQTTAAAHVSHRREVGRRSQSRTNSQRGLLSEWPCNSIPQHLEQPVAALDHFFRRRVFAEHLILRSTNKMRGPPSDIAQ